MLSLPPVHGAESVLDVKIDIPYKKFVLPNGLTRIVHEDHKAPIVAVNLWYHVGSKNEKPGKTGFAHLFEHLMFTGSEHFKGGADQRAFFEVMEQIGATDLNGTTSEDRTDFFENVPRNALDVALWIESDRMGHLLGAIDQAKPALAPGSRAQTVQAGRGVLTAPTPDPAAVRPAVAQVAEVAKGGGVDACIPATAGRTSNISQ